jgi:hypothetical protein
VVSNPSNPSHAISPTVLAAFFFRPTSRGSGSARGRGIGKNFIYSFACECRRYRRVSAGATVVRVRVSYSKWTNRSYSN